MALRIAELPPHLWDLTPTYSNRRLYYYGERRRRFRLCLVSPLRP